MTETDWAESHDPVEMLDALRHNTNDPRLWQYVMQCLHGVGAEDAAVVLREYIAGNQDDASLAAQRLEFEETAQQRGGGGYSMGRKPVHITKAALRAKAALAAFQSSPWLAAEQVTLETRHELQRHQCMWLRCLFANPYRSVQLDPTWLSSTVTALSRKIDEDGEYDLMPILGDALIDAGCENADLIQHCQTSQEHTQNCWVLNLLLGTA